MFPYPVVRGDVGLPRRDDAFPRLDDDLKPLRDVLAAAACQCATSPASGDLPQNDAIAGRQSTDDDFQPAVTGAIL